MKNLAAHTTRRISDRETGEAKKRTITHDNGRQARKRLTPTSGRTAAAAVEWEERGMGAQRQRDSENGNSTQQDLSLIHISEPTRPY